MKPNLVLGLCANYALDVVEPFLASFLKYCQSAQLCLFTTNMDLRFNEVVAQHHITVKDAAPFLLGPTHIQNARYFMYESYLQECGDKYDRVLLTDVRDVFFQSDPFAVPLPSSVCFAAEDGFLGQEPVNRAWIERLYGRELLAEVADNTISCSGTVIGRLQELRLYVALMCVEIRHRQHTDEWGTDQGVHNYLVWKISPKFGAVDMANRIVKTVGITDAARIKIVNETVLIDGYAPPVIHQWDRHTQLEAHVAESPRFKIPRPETQSNHEMPA